MALVHRADLKPSKIELLQEWLPRCDWCAGDGPVTRVSAFRFDDPAGEVGLETFIVEVDGSRYHVPLAYRGQPLEGGTLVGTLEHSVLGTRWVYDGPSDPVYVDVVRDAIVRAGRDVDMVLDDGTPVPRLEWWAAAVGSGATDEQSAWALRVARRLPDEPPSGAPVLTAEWSGEEPVVVAWLVDPEEQ